MQPQNVQIRVQLPVQILNALSLQQIGDPIFDNFMKSQVQFAGASTALARDATVALLDTIGPDVWTDPGSLYEALELAIMDPIVALAETVAALYAVQEVYFNEFAVPRIPLPKLYRLPFQLPDWERGKLLEWSYSNAVTLWNAGYDAVQPFLPNPSQTEPAQQYRYYNTLALESREDAFLRLFGDPLRNLPQTV